MISLGISKSDYSKMADKASPNSPKLLNAVKAFLFGGGICLLGQLLNAPIDPAALAAEIQSAEQGEDLYRLSCMIVDIDHFMERSYLDALAAALKISEARKGQLEEEARQAKAQLATHAG